MYIQLDFLLRRFKEQAEADPSLRDRQPYQAAYTGDLTWLGDAVTKHYQGDDTDVKPLVAAILTAYHEINVDEHARLINDFFAAARHPTLDRPYTECGYAPMVELLRYLEAGGFTNYIVSGGGRDFMRPITGPLYGIPPERVVGSSVGLVYRDGHLYTTSTARIPRRRPDQAGAAVEPHRTAAHLRGGELQRRHRDAAVHREQVPDPRYSCWCCTTTPTASSTTSAAPRRHSTSRRPTAGRSPASRTIGRPSSPTRFARTRKARAGHHSSSPARLTVATVELAQEGVDDRGIRAVLAARGDHRLAGGGQDLRFQVRGPHRVLEGGGLLVLVTVVLGRNPVLCQTFSALSCASSIMSSSTSPLARSSSSRW